MCEIMPLNNIVLLIKSWIGVAQFLTCDEVVHQRCRNAEDPNQQITDCQVEDEQVCDCAHASVFQHNQTHQDVPHHTQEEDEGVSQKVAGGDIQRVLIVGEKCDVGEIGRTV